MSKEKQEAAKLFTDYCLTDECQAIAKEKGFNRRNDYKSQDSGLDGAGYLAKQRVWKQNKNGGKPIIAVFVADTSGSMDGEPLASLKNSLISSSAYISEDNYIGQRNWKNFLRSTKLPASRQIRMTLSTTSGTSSL